MWRFPVDLLDDGLGFVTGPPDEYQRLWLTLREGFRRRCS